MTIHTHIEPGGKSVCEDYIIVRRHPANHSVVICALADGQGGREFGHEAATAACESIWASASALPPSKLFDDGVWQTIIDTADLATEQTGGFTTLVALALDRDSAAGASSGDSKAFFRLPGQSDIAEWTHRQPKNPPVGSASAAFEPFMCHAIGGGRLILASDGVWKYCGYDALRQGFDVPLDQIASHLKAAILRRSGSALPDDFSIIAIDID